MRPQKTSRLDKIVINPTLHNKKVAYWNCPLNNKGARTGATVCEKNLPQQVNVLCVYVGTQSRFRFLILLSGRLYLGGGKKLAFFICLCML